MPVTKVDEAAARVRQLLRELLLGREDPEGFFCACLSVLGETDTRSRFLGLIKPLSSAHAQLYSHLATVFQQYFSEDEDLELEVALALSLHEAKAEVKGQRSAPPPLAQSYGQVTAAESGRGQEGAGVEFDNPERSEKRPVTKWTLTKAEMQGMPVSAKKRPESLNAELPLADSCVELAKEASNHQNEKSSRRRRQRRRQLLSQQRNPTGPRPILYWMRRDLRLWDNPALIGCLEQGGPIIPIFLWNASEEEGPGVSVAMGGASKYWLHQTLKSFNQSLEQRGSHLITQRAEPSSLDALMGLVEETGAGTVVATALYEPWLKERDEQVFEALQKRGVNCQLHHSYCLRDPYSVSTQGVGLRGIGSVSHFMSCCQQNSGSGSGAPLDAPEGGGLPGPTTWPGGCPLEQLGLARMPRRKDGTVVDWAANIRKEWDFSEEGAHARLDAFLHDGVYRYDKESGRADAPNTSCVSPYLHWGQLSARWLLWDAKGACCRPPKFQRKLAWRDLAYWQLALFPDLPWESLRPPYKALRWSTEQAHLKAWQRGRTGFPLVDAAMRQLWLTGWMNNYMRHVVASFLIAYLTLPWQQGYRWFQDTLVDADVAIDAMMWQNGGMCGLDHWNFVMHPVDAAMTCDPYGAYVRKWCPELAALPDDLIHKPWKCPASMLRRAGVVLGGNYPERIVLDLEDRRQSSLREVALVRKRFSQFVDPRSGCDLVPLPARLVQEALGSPADVCRGGTGSGTGFLLPVITRMEFKHQTQDPDASHNPYSAVLRGYVSRKRDETVAFLNERDFTASVMCESARRQERLDRDQRLMEGLPRPAGAKTGTGRGRARRTPIRDPFSTVPAGVAIARV